MLLLPPIDAPIAIRIIYSYGSYKSLVDFKLGSWKAKTQFLLEIFYA